MITWPEDGECVSFSPQVRVLHGNDAHEIYSMTGFTAAEAAGWPAYVLNESHVYLGLTMIYNEDTVGGATVDCELSISTDSVVWRRMFPGVPFIPR